MRGLRTALLIVILTLVIVPDVSSVFAQSPRGAASTTFAQAERNSVDLKHGMSIDEVERLLGKPRRTTLKNANSMDASSPGILQWTYSWTANSSSPATLQVEFAAKAPEAWYVSSWEWMRY